MNKQNFYDVLYKLKNSSFNRFNSKSYSQEGEDLILSRYFDSQKQGFFIDVGAFHPIRFSNTYLFYRLGWSGINIEARPGSKKLFDQLRKRDINIEIPINDSQKELTYYCFNEPALNGFSPQLSDERNGMRNFKVVKEIKMKTKRLDNILDKYMPLGREIDFMSIDVESLDLNVLKSNSWSKYKPKIVVVEDSEYDFKIGSEISIFLESHNYKIFARTINTSFFKFKDE